MRVWLNGTIVDAAEARISPFDRGFLFGDGVYEGIRFFAGQGVGMDLHIARLQRSLQLIRLDGFRADELATICEALIRAAGTPDAMVYFQITRGVHMPRTHLPNRNPSPPPTVFAYAAAAPSLDELTAPLPRRAITRPDLRWHRCDIKSTNLLANILAIDEAHEHGVDEAILHRDGWVSEGTMTNVFIVRGDVLITPPVDVEPSILHGVTRAMLLERAVNAGVRAQIRPIALDELHDAEEVMIASSRRLLDGVVEVDGHPVGTGSIGPVTTRLFAAMRDDLAVRFGVALHSSP